MLFSPPATDPRRGRDRALRAYRVIGSPGYPLDEAASPTSARRSFDRGYDPVGVARQLRGDTRPHRTVRLVARR